MLTFRDGSLTTMCCNGSCSASHTTVDNTSSSIDAIALYRKEKKANKNTFKTKKKQNKYKCYDSIEAKQRARASNGVDDASVRDVDCLSLSFVFVDLSLFSTFFDDVVDAAAAAVDADLSTDLALDRLPALLPPLV